MRFDTDMIVIEGKKSCIQFVKTITNSDVTNN